MVEGIIDITLPPMPCDTPAGDKITCPACEASGHFLAGPENRLIAVVVRSVLNEQPNGYNPIVLHGPSGAGKSHLALAIAAQWNARYRRRAECVAAVDFARELAEAVEMQAIEEFREKYRRAGLVVIEDIGRLVNRKSEKLCIQDELLHALDDLTGRGAWVIVTSMNAPSAMPGLKPALQSRLTAGLAVPLVLPEPDTRLAIIKHLAELRKIDLTEPAATTLAEGLNGSVPELLGALVQLDLSARRGGSPIEAKDVRLYLARRGKERTTGIHAVALAAARHFGLKLSDLRGPSQQRAVVAARNAAAYLARKTIKCSFDEIGRYFGGRDHTTIMHGWRNMGHALDSDPAMRGDMRQLEKKVHDRIPVKKKISDNISDKHAIRARKGVKVAKIGK